MQTALALALGIAAVAVALAGAVLGAHRRRLRLLAGVHHGLAVPGERPITTVIRTSMSLYLPYVDWLREGHKTTTIRWRPRAIERADDDELPLYATSSYLPGSPRILVGRVKIHSVSYERFGDLTSLDAERDGFTSLEAMRIDLQEIYPQMRDDHWVTIYTISLIT